MGESKRRKMAGGSDGGPLSRVGRVFRISGTGVGGILGAGFEMRDDDVAVLANVLSLYHCQIIVQSISGNNPDIKSFQEASDLCEDLANKVSTASEMGMLCSEVIGAAHAVFSGLAAVRKVALAANDGPVGRVEAEDGVTEIFVAYRDRVRPLAASFGVEGLYLTLPWKKDAALTVMSNLMALPEDERDAMLVRMYPVVN